jgi:hypothetical protein
VEACFVVDTGWCAFTGMAKWPWYSLVAAKDRVAFFRESVHVGELFRKWFGP